jgi:hypothetical protein
MGPPLVRFRGQESSDQRTFRSDRDEIWLGTGEVAQGRGLRVERAVAIENFPTDLYLKIFKQSSGETRTELVDKIIEQFLESGASSYGSVHPGPLSVGDVGRTEAAARR